MRINLRDLRMVSAFALALRTETYIRAFIERVQAKKRNVIRVGSETGGWEDNNLEWLPPGPKINSKEARKNVRRVLRVAADTGIWVQLVVGFTERDDHKATKRWARSMAKIAKPFDNVLLSAMNEPQMSNWTVGELIELLDILRPSGCPVGVDQPCEGGRWRYNRELARHCDYLDMHPRRNPDLSKAELRNIFRKNGRVLFSETTCYLSNANAKRWPNLRGNNNFYLDGRKREKAQWKAYRAYMKRVLRAGHMWGDHSIDLIKCNTLDFRLPKYKGG